MTSTPHDALFKLVFEAPEHAAGELQAVLPQALAQALDWTTLTSLPTSSLDRQLGEHHTDLLFSIHTRGGTETLLYLLFEHQSTPDPQMPFRLLGYMLAIWQAHRGKHGKARRLPPIVPLVLYQGERRWSAPRSLTDLVDLPAGLEQELEVFVPTFDYLLDDLSAVSDEALRARAMMTAFVKLVMSCLKHFRGEQPAVEVLQAWVEELHEAIATPHGIEVLNPLFRYTHWTRDRGEVEAVRQFLVEEIGPQAGDRFMTYAEELIQEGVEKGIQQGIEKGIQQGKVEGERNLLLQQLRQRFGEALGPEAERRIQTAEIAQIETWARRVLSAATLDDVLAD